MGKNNKIGSVVRIRQMVKQWQKKAQTHIGSNKEPPVSDVPPGHVAVTVGENRRRYVVRAKHLNHPIFRRLLAEAEEEYGFSNVGPLAIPCDESLFEEIIRVVTRSESSGRGGPATLEDIRRCCHVGVAARKVEYLGESRPLLPAIAEKSVC
ncbi:SAUR-like auxin-responsive protein family [Raphanus sativus]|uniref:Auxin-responsive protein SAUR50 n=1 Tax=Raphanus sativus TaxID=3726 RepID=A0A6J0M8K0_RAPSA|nr:auxin-responsive protein SAUR50 [Raphanus sativus]XP_056859857.1 auxin-responsive protein SAUR50-like [Raphanus sativus]KAJ4872599.1 SAUR-like auxin-responsive protein family [Raphanus sativus]KAJ4914310.1 SAUR-like auxin-responsive protein family [Raphanus sativus]